MKKKYLLYNGYKKDRYVTKFTSLKVKIVSTVPHTQVQKEKEKRKERVRKRREK